MSWYSFGTLTVTQGSRIITGSTGLNFKAIGEGAGLVINGAVYGLESITDESTASLYQAWPNASASAVEYIAFPTESRASEILDEVMNLMAEFGPIRGSADDFNALIAAKADQVEEDRAAVEAMLTQVQAARDTTITNATLADERATNAAASETNAAASAAAALASEQAASASEANAAASEASATASATSASASELAAATSETNAAASETAAAGSATAAGAAKTAAEAARILAQQFRDAAEAAKDDAVAAEAAAWQAVADALAARDAAATSETNADASAQAALTAQTIAETARDQSLEALDQFDDRYLGDFAVDPVADNDGAPLRGGALYFNDVAGEMRVFNGTTWVSAYVSGNMFLALSGGTLTGPLTLPGAPTAANHAATKAYVDAGVASAKSYADTGLATKIDTTIAATKAELAAGLATKLDGAGGAIEGDLNVTGTVSADQVLVNGSAVLTEATLPVESIQGQARDLAWFFNRR